MPSFTSSSSLSSHSSMPSLTTLTFDSEDFETNSECTNIFFMPETHHFLYPVPPYLVPYIPDPYFVIADWYLLIEKTTYHTNDPEVSMPSPSYFFYLFAENIAPLPNIYAKLPNSLFTHITLP